MHGEVDLGTEEQIMKTPKIQELTTDEQRDETVLPDSQDTIPDDLLPNLNHTDVCFYYLRKKSKYDPNRSYKFSTVDWNFMNIIRYVHDVYSADAENLTAGGHVAHLNEYINEFHLHAVVPWHTVEDIYIPVNIKEKYHWVLAILSFSERCIFLYDSYESSGHYSVVLDAIEKLAAVIPLCLEHCDFYVKKGIHVENHPRYKDKDSSDMFDVLFQEKYLSYGHKILGNYFGPNALRTRYAALLWDYGIRKQGVNAHSDVEAPLRPLKQSRITSVTEVFDHTDVCFYYLRKKSKYDPNRSYKFSTVDWNFMNIIRYVHDVYSADAENLTAGGHVAHLNEYINEFHLHAVVPWHTVEDIYIPVNIKEKYHWVLAILSFSERCIFLYDSYESSGHYSVVLDAIEKLAAVIPLCLEHCDFYVKKGIHVENHPRYKDKDSSDMFDVLFQESLP
ncbi:hypothetical protein BC332_03675 [Capsicum chinense]|nr:hypothetical protein BC332_03675 [Capsicum chinense]